MPQPRWFDQGPRMYALACSAAAAVGKINTKVLCCTHPGDVDILGHTLKEMMDTFDLCEHRFQEKYPRIWLFARTAAAVSEKVEIHLVTWTACYRVALSNDARPWDPMVSLFSLILTESWMLHSLNSRRMSPWTCHDEECRNPKNPKDAHVEWLVSLFESTWCWSDSTRCWFESHWCHVQVVMNWFELDSSCNLFLLWLKWVVI